MKATMQLPIFRITFSIALLCLSGISQAAQSADPLSTLPADPQQTTQPQWVKAVPPYPLTLFSKAEVDLNSVKQGDNGQITAWERDTYEKPQQPSTDYVFQIGEAHYLIDCNDGKYTSLAVNTRRANGDLVRSVPMPESVQKYMADVPPDSLISAEVTLACAQAKKNWPIDQHYDLHIKPKHVATITPLTSQEKEKIDQAIAQRKETDKRNAPVVEPLLTAQNGKNLCHTMNGVDGNPSSYELCDAQGMFSHDVYSVRIGGIIFLRGIDDDTTKGIDGVFYGSPIRLQCEPVNQLADGVTNKTIEGAIQADRMSSKKISFDDELRFAILTNVVEIGRHCTLSNTDGVMAKLDVVSP
jgi:hypothetical protein